MHLGDGVEWALHCSVVLAGLPEGSRLPGRDLARYHGVSESYLLKHLQALVRAGLLESLPGPQGGFRLARQATDISVLDVVEAIDGGRPAFRCSEIRRRQPGAADGADAYRHPCPINATMLAAEAEWKAVLRSRSIADLLLEIHGASDHVALMRGAEWLSERARS